MIDVNKYLAVDIGGSFVKTAIVDQDANILKSTKDKTPQTLDALLDLIVNYSLNNQDIQGIAISCPGSVSNEGVVYGSSAIPYIHGPNIKELIHKRVPLPIFMENDANCAGYAEIWNGAAKGKKDVMVVVIGTGIGGAIIKNGKLHKGAHLHGGEFGYMLLTSNVHDDNDVWSRTASTKSLVRKVAKIKNINERDISGEDVFQWAEEGDSDCQRAIDEFYHLLAVGIYNLQYIYDPEIILIGGGISARNDLIPKINEKLDIILSKLTLPKIKPQIGVCKYRQNANLLGAVYGLINKFK
jgi:predicted NBD/HSP70 family sugar kinase